MSSSKKEFLVMKVLCCKFCCFFRHTPLLDLNLAKSCDYTVVISLGIIVKECTIPNLLTADIIVSDLIDKSALTLPSISSTILLVRDQSYLVRHLHHTNYVYPL